MTDGKGLTGSTTTETTRSVAIALSIILVLAFALRVWGIWFGLPYIYHGDEGFEVRRALQLGTGSFNFDRTAKGGYFYVLFIEYGLLFLCLKILGVVESAKDFGQLYFRDPSSFYLVGRATTAAIGTLTVFITYLIAKKAYGIRAGIVAALFIAFNLLHVRLSHFITVDVPMTCLVMASLFYAVRMAQGDSRTNYWWAALFAGLAVSTKLPAIMMIVSLLTAHYFYVKTSGTGLRQLFLGRNLWIAITIFLVVYLLTNPGIVFNFGDVARGMLAKFGIGRGEVDAEMGIVVPLQEENLFFFYASHLIESMHLPLFIACIVGMGYALWKRSRADIVLTSFAIPYYLVVSSSTDPFYVGRYILPIIPVLTILGARLLNEIASAIGERYKAAPLALALILALPPAYSIALHDYKISQKDTRTYAKEWMERNVPNGATVFIEGLNGRVDRKTVPLRKSEEVIRQYLKQYRSTDPGKAKYFSAELGALTGYDGKTFNLVIVSNENLDDFTHYKDRGVEYFVTRPEVFLESWKKRASLFPQFLTDLKNDPDTRLVQSFKPDPTSVPGPLIEIYRVETNLPADNESQNEEKGDEK